MGEFDLVACFMSVGVGVINRDIVDVGHVVGTPCGTANLGSFNFN